MVTESQDLHPLERQLLVFLSRNGTSSETEIIEESELPDEGSYRRASQWLLSRKLIREVSREVETTVELGPVGVEYRSDDYYTPYQALESKLADGADLTFQDIQEDRTYYKAQWGTALGALTKAGAVVRGDDGFLRFIGEKAGVFRRVIECVYEPLNNGDIVNLATLPEDVADFVRSRSPKRGKNRAEFVLVEKTHSRLEITDEGRTALESSLRTATIGSLTPGILSDGSWREARFRKYKVDIPPSRIHMGRMHPYRQFLDIVRKKFTAMGFTEMRGSLAENEFWNNDALFMPQFHPARDIHDAYFLEGAVSPPPDEFIDAVAEVHENGGETGGRGWEYCFDRKRALQTVLRSQGTALSVRCLASNPAVPGKYFGIARCFRYDQVDSTHLPDFFQIEGIVLSEETNLKNLLGLLKLFAEEIAGAAEYKFLPAYFPFTEPSVEMHVKHPRLGWIELGGAGLFREEVCAPLGVDVPVIAWGLGLDRMAMLALGLDDIRDLFSGDLSVLRQMTSRPDQLLSPSGIEGIQTCPK
jgi:phenylalanyl-tRNA synthetase alpha chain